MLGEVPEEIRERESWPSAEILRQGQFSGTAPGQQDDNLRQEVGLVPKKEKERRSTLQETVD